MYFADRECTVPLYARDATACDAPAELVSEGRVDECNAGSPGSVRRVMQMYTGPVFEENFGDCFPSSPPTGSVFYELSELLEPAAIFVELEASQF